MLLSNLHYLPLDGVFGLAKKFTNIVDFRESLSTISLLKVTQLFEKMEPDEILEIHGTDVDMQHDVFKVLPEMSYEVILSERENNKSDFYCIKIRKLK